MNRKGECGQNVPPRFGILEDGKGTKRIQFQELQDPLRPRKVRRMEDREAADEVQQPQSTGAILTSSNVGSSDKDKEDRVVVVAPETEISKVVDREADGTVTEETDTEQGSETQRGCTPEVSKPHPKESTVSGARTRTADTEMATETQRQSNSTEVQKTSAGTEESTETQSVRGVCVRGVRGGRGARRGNR